MNAYDSSYRGITPEDFTELNHWFDEQGILFLDKLDRAKNSPEKEFPTYKFDPERVKPKAHNYQELLDDVANDTRNHWKNKSKCE